MPDSPSQAQLIADARGLLAGLTPVTHLLNDNERNLVAKLHAAIERYGDRAYVTEPQVKYLRDIAKKHWHDPRQLTLI